MPAMPTTEFCLPKPGKAVPSGPHWIHEIKYDGYRLRLERDGDRVRLFSRGGHDWAGRYPWIVETARKIRKTRFIIDGEAVVLGVDASLTSTPCTPAGTTTRPSCTPSTAFRITATTSAGCRCTCARPTSRSFSGDGPRGSS
jgi:ATP dependent DNA ligase domain